MRDLESRLREQIGEGTELRVAPGRGLLFVRVVAGGTGYWIGFPLPRHPSEDEPIHAIVWSLALAAVLLASAFLFRPLHRPAAARPQCGRRARRPRRDAAAAAGKRPVGDRDAQSRIQRDDAEPAPAGAGPRAAARRRVARPAHAARQAAARHRDGRTRCRARAREWSTTSRKWTGSSASFSISRAATTKPRRSPSIPMRSCRPASSATSAPAASLQFRPGSVPMVRLRSHGVLAARRQPDRQCAVLRRSRRSRSRRRSPAGDFVLEVADRGPGIAPGDVDAGEAAVLARIGRAQQRERGRGRGTRSRHRRAHRPHARRPAGSRAARRRRQHRARRDSRLPRNAAPVTPTSAGPSPARRCPPRVPRSPVPRSSSPSR